jgi:hypothetical protein
VKIYSIVFTHFVLDLCCFLSDFPFSGTIRDFDQDVCSLDPFSIWILKSIGTSSKYQFSMIKFPGNEEEGLYIIIKRSWKIQVKWEMMLFHVCELCQHRVKSHSNRWESWLEFLIDNFNEIFIPENKVKWSKTDFA